MIGSTSAPKPRRSRYILAVAMSLTFVAAGCGGDGATAPPAPADTSGPLAELAQKAKAEGTLTWYTTVPPEAAEATAKVFTDAYGVKVEVNRQTSATLAPLLTTEVEGNNVKVDVAELGNVQFMKASADKGWFIKQSPTTLPALTNWPKAWIYADSMYPQAIAMFGITYNKDLSKTAPTEWSALTDPKYKGKIMMVDPRSNSSTIDLLDRLQTQYGDGYVRALGTQSIQFSASGTNSINSLGAGEATLAVPGVRWQTTALIDKGAPLDDAFPRPAMTGSEQWAAAVKGSPHPNAAQLFLNFILSEAGQVATCANRCSSVIHAPNTIPFPDDYVSPKQIAPERRTQLLTLMGLSGS